MQYQKPVLIQEQKMKLSPQMFQSIQLMALPVQDLKFRIQEEVDRNPALEIKDQKKEISIDEVSSSRRDDYDYFENSSDPGFFSSASPDSDSKRMFIEGVLSREESLQEHLLSQLRIQPVGEDIFRAGELLIQNLDENGFFIEEPESLDKNISADSFRKAAELINRFDPQGTCTSGYRESLIVQTRLAEEAPEYTVEILEDFLELLEKGRFREIAKSLKIRENQVTAALDFIKTLNPFPGRQFAPEDTRYVIPDLLIKVSEGELVIKLNEEEIPVLGISPSFEDLTGEDFSGAKSAKKFVNSSIKDARWFIQTIGLRNQTLLKTATAIAFFQKNFFLKGPRFLHPLTLKDIAEEVGVHETTISRISNSKYIQTDWGIFPLKYFFSTALARTDSAESSVSRESVKFMLKEIIETEGKDRHLSDQKLADYLKEKNGIKIARRTVAKYRKELDIASSYDR